MKFCLNGGLIIGTMDGANIEILEEVGEDNIFIFGLTTDQIAKLKPYYRPRDYIEKNVSLQRVLDQIGNGFFSPEEPKRYKLLHDNLTTTDPYFLMADFESYVETQERIDKVFFFSFFIHTQKKKKKKKKTKIIKLKGIC